MFIFYHKTNKALKLYFRRLYIYVFKTNKEHDHPHTLYECLEKQERRCTNRTWIVIVTIPACCLCLLLTKFDTGSVLNAVKNPIVSAVQTVQKLNVLPILATVQENVTEISTTVGYRGKQLQATTHTPVRVPANLMLPLYSKDVLGLFHRQYVSSYDIIRGRLANERKINRMKEHRNVFTPINLGIEEAATYKTIEKDNLLLPSCTVHQNITEKMKFTMDLTLRNFENLTIPKNAYPMVRNGGYFRPSECSSRHKVAIIVPYRNQSKCLTVFLFNIHPFLMNQNLEYRVFVIEQYGNRELNRGRLFNAGFKEAEKYGKWKCVVFHDVNLLPMSGLILYTCPIFPRQMSTIIIASNGTIMNTTQSEIYGSVTAMTVKQYLAVNGYSNLYWGWNIQEYDLSLRFHQAKIRLVRYSRLISKYLLLPGEAEMHNHTRVVLLANAAERYRREGLNQLEYRIISIKHDHLHTHIVVDIDDNY